MKNIFLSFIFLFWCAVIVFIIIVSYLTGKEKLARYEFTEGVVIDRVLLPVRGKYRPVDIYFSQWQYTVGQDTFFFVHKRGFNRLKKIGTKRKIIYLKEKHDVAQVYSFDFWVRLPFILVTLMIAIFIFAIRQFIVHWNSKTWFANRYRNY